MTDHPHKLNRLAMHQEWYDKNRTLLFIEASVVMQELLAMCRQYKAEHDALRAERDEARREVCAAKRELCRDEAIIRLQRHRVHRDSEDVVGLAKEIAVERGWDCFKENTDD